MVRLKGGDPMLFGRGGEEWAAIRGAGIPVEVINGISSGLAAATGIGVPLTHRDYASGVIFVTGHATDGDEPRWADLARSRLTLVIYMGVARAPMIRAGLLAGGMSRSMPVAVVRNASLPSTAALRTSLGDFPEAIVAAGLGSPAIIVIGSVVDLALALSPVTGVSAPAQGARQSA